MRTKGVFVIKKHEHGSFSFVLKSSNNKPILYSCVYASKKACENGIENIRKYSVHYESFDKTDDNNGDPIFYLKASNGQIIGWSNHYSDEKARENGILSVMKHAESAIIKELV